MMDYLINWIDINPSLFLYLSFNLGWRVNFTFLYCSILLNIFLGNVNEVVGILLSLLRFFLRIINFAFIELIGNLGGVSVSTIS